MEASADQGRPCEDAAELREVEARKAIIVVPRGNITVDPTVLRPLYHSQLTPLETRTSKPPSWVKSKKRDRWANGKKSQKLLYSVHDVGRRTSAWLDAVTVEADGPDGFWVLEELGS